jgi:hypothetical protein
MQWSHVGNLFRRHYTQHNDIQHNDIQHNNIQQSDIQDNDIQHNNKAITTLSITTLNALHWMSCWLTFILIVANNSIMLSDVMLNAVVPLFHPGSL